MTTTPEFLPSPARLVDAGNSPRWHPLSQQELADKAMQLAQQMSAARASQARAGASTQSLIGAAPLATGSFQSPSSPSVNRPQIADDLRETPQE